MEKRTLNDIDFYGKKVLLRVDFNVPLDGKTILDDNRITEALPTIKFILDKGGCLILMSHLGRPDGKVDKKYSLKPVFEHLKVLLGDIKVSFAKDVVGEDAVKKAKNLKMGEVLLLENLRFEPGEEENSVEFCEKLSSLGELYINDAFGTAHRKHASTYGIAKILPSGIGFLIEKELAMISGTLEKPKHPFVVVLGGAKVSDKIGIVNHLLDKADAILIGGGMAFTFLKAKGYKIGNSLVDEEKIEFVKEFLQNAEEKGVKVVLPCDHIVAKSVDSTEGQYINNVEISDGFMGLDIGTKTIKTFYKIIKKAKTVIWNGPMGVYSEKNDVFNSGTVMVAKAMSKCKGITIVGGGDSAAAVFDSGYYKKIKHISTGGGASLKLFEGKVLPGVDIIQNK